MAVHSLPSGTPSAEGVDARGIIAFLDAVEAAPGIDMHSLMVLRHGTVIAQGWWAPYTPGRRHLLYSLSKSFTSTAAGFAVAEGLLRLDDPVVSYFPEFDAEITDPGSRSILVRHVASMASGHLTDQWDAAVARDRAEPVRGFLLGPPDREPGTVFAYNQPCTYTLAAIVQRTSGQTLTEYLRSRLFDPLGIGETTWGQHPKGRDLGYSGLHATTDSVARLGQFYLQRGAWEGRQLLSREWVVEATRVHVDNAAASTNPDWQQGYCLQFWKSRHGYRGDGAYGQFCLVLPVQGAVIATTAETDKMAELLDLVWEHLLPAFDGGLPGGDADAALERRLARLALPPVPARAELPAGGGAWDGSEFAPVDGDAAPRSLTGVRLAKAEGQWAVDLDEDGSPLVLRLARNGWNVSAERETAPTAVSGGWTDADTLRFDVLFLETPHRLTVTCRLPDRTFSARWRTTPLHVASLRDLHA
jgi:CubicO group peptidase (beta-lactamase class C family)